MGICCYGGENPDCEIPIKKGKKVQTPVARVAAKDILDSASNPAITTHFGLDSIVPPTL
jgi:hypothetical protein